MVIAATQQWLAVVIITCFQKGEREFEMSGWLGGERQEWGWRTDNAMQAEEAWQCVRVCVCAGPA